MAPELTTIEAAREIVLGEVRPLPPERVELGDAQGRYLAVEGIAAEDVPGFDNSAMDGYAVRATDLSAAGDDAPVRLELIGESRAGSPAPMALETGQAIAISTGAMVPEGADTVVRFEDTRLAGETAVDFIIAPEPARNIRRAGEDVRAGDKVLAPGTQLGPAELGVLVSLGAAWADCAARPRVAVVVSGDELVRPGEPMRPGGVRDSNAWTVPALARSCGADVISVDHVGDDMAATERVIGAALTADVLVVTGGVSVGPHDHIKGALASQGAREVFWRVALRPGKPTWFGVGPSGTLCFGLPGNPVSAMVTFLLFARPALLALQGADPARTRSTAILDAPVPKPVGRADAVRCSLTAGEDGWHASPTGAQGSHILTSMLGADALALIPTDAEGAEPGDRVDVEFLPRA